MGDGRNVDDTGRRVRVRVVRLLPGALPSVGDMERCLDRGDEGRYVGGGPKVSRL